LAEFVGRVLIIAGSDSGGGAGIQADIKTVTMLGGYAATAITALTAQNTLGVAAVRRVPSGFIRSQIVSVLTDIGADAVKIGTLFGPREVETVTETLDLAPLAPVVVDPVAAASDGRPLLSKKGLAALIALLIPRAGLLTPNAHEATLLTGLPATSLDELRAAGEALLKRGAGAALMKGGHLAGPTVTDLLMTPAGERLFEGPRIATRHTHGTGCTLASACATGLAQGMALEAAVERGWDYTARAIRAAPGLGAGAGPLGHGWPLEGR
jgi:hydroxymethylpyrimidine/phosphomethylpyrimidine kinase